jgi:hypothetical protein
MLASRALRWRVQQRSRSFHKHFKRCMARVARRTQRVEEAALVRLTRQSAAAPSAMALIRAWEDIACLANEGEEKQVGLERWKLFAGRRVSDTSARKVVSLRQDTESSNRSKARRQPQMAIRHSLRCRKARQRVCLRAHQDEADRRREEGEQREASLQDRVTFPVDRSCLRSRRCVLHRTGEETRAATATTLAQAP